MIFVPIYDKFYIILIYEINIYSVVSTLILKLNYKIVSIEHKFVLNLNVSGKGKKTNSVLTNYILFYFKTFTFFGNLILRIYFIFF